MASNSLQTIQLHLKVPKDWNRNRVVSHVQNKSVEVTKVRMPRATRTGKAKGRNMERDTAKALSLWWSDGEDDHIFAPRMASGGAGRDIGGRSGAAGDIHADKSAGELFIKRWVVECKSYEDITSELWQYIQGDGFASGFSSFWQQVQDSARVYRRYSLLIVKSNQRQPLVFTDDVELYEMVLTGSRLPCAVRSLASPFIFPFKVLLETEVKEVRSRLCISTGNTIKQRQRRFKR